MIDLSIGSNGSGLGEVAEHKTSLELQNKKNLKKERWQKY